MIRLIIPVMLVCLAGLAPRPLHGQVPKSCAPVFAAYITGADLAAAVPQLASLKPNLMVANSPTPGMMRYFMASDLQRLARRYGFDANIRAAVCFAWPVHTLTGPEIIAALRKSMAALETEIEITDQLHTPVPDGEVVFPIGSLSAVSSKPTTWSGYVRYGGDRKFATWVQVRVTVHEQQIIAARALRAGELISQADFLTVAYSGPLRHTTVIHQSSDIAGKCARQPIAAGAVLLESMLAPPQDVEKQQLVTVHVDCGAAHIETQGIAVNAGYRGDIIKVRNPKTGRIFLARVGEPGKVTVVPGGAVGLVVEDKKS